MSTESRPDVVVIMTDQERAAPPYESDELTAWRRDTLASARWFDEHAVSFRRHYTGSLACVPSRPTIFTGQYPRRARRHPDQRARQDGRRLADAVAPPRRGADARALVPGGRVRHALRRQVAHHPRRPARRWGERIDTNDDDGNVLTDGVQRYLDADPLDEFGFSGWVGPEPHAVDSPTRACAATRSSPTVSSRGSTTATPVGVLATPTPNARSCSW